MHGIKRIVIFCTLITVLPTMLLIVPLYLRHSIYADVQFAVTESDIVEITDGISPIFCSAHTLKMNETFHAFQVSRRPEKAAYRKHIRLKKSMTLPDDTLEYWGFYLLKGATVALSVCSRFKGSSILVVKGERNLRTCGMLDHNKNKAKATGIFLPEADQQVKITFESNAQEVNSKEFISMTKAEATENNCLNCTNKESNVQERNLTNVIEPFNGKLTNHLNIQELHNILNNERKLEFLSSPAYKDLNRDINSNLDKTNFNKSRHLKERIRKLHSLNDEYIKKNDDENDDVRSYIILETYREKNRKDIKGKELNKRYERRVRLLEEELGLDHENGEIEENNYGEEQDIDSFKIRQKRSQQPIKPEILDRGIKHGGNAVKNLLDGDSSASSFENGLLHCYGGNVLLTHEFDPSSECVNVTYLLNGNKHMQTIHEVAEDGYYYYIFYSDNDIVSNDIHAVFEIYKPTLQYENVTNACLNQTECNFPLSITSVDRVIVEVPTKDGIDHEIDDISVLVSTCVPRMGIYAIFPIAVLFFILGCAFM
ncbi:PREDICTED: uncharacterized protein LOC105363492 isoform X2 [Ceratosolen solmsi marchali]|nr:PREDICTED: uncharacterized protein LOC105363492 isoform X2 [Ceratosolen solmsi marchali]XP_011499515.1 PREDICTED: uncharacterized protein LOC105363492 isoform X2 [Ceratosolen solmsi marchali]XP_011499516.1 PREDICTED: uncharacterized protein LOC105363492 isoform X2 [Ceratosolen solmsi marchali]